MSARTWRFKSSPAHRYSKTPTGVFVLCAQEQTSLLWRDLNAGAMSRPARRDGEAVPSPRSAAAQREARENPLSRVIKETASKRASPRFARWPICIEFFG